MITPELLEVPMGKSSFSVVVLPVAALVALAGCSRPVTSSIIGPPNYLYSDEYYDACIENLPPSAPIPQQLVGIARTPTPLERCRVQELLAEAFWSPTCGSSTYLNGLNFVFSGKFWVLDSPGTSSFYQGRFAFNRTPLYDASGNVTGYDYIPEGFALNSNALFGVDREASYNLLHHEISNRGHAGDLEAAWAHQDDPQSTPYHSAIYNIAAVCAQESMNNQPGGPL